MIKKIICLVCVLMGAIVFSSIQASDAKIVMSYWSSPKNLASEFSYPIPGSFDKKGKVVDNQDMQAKLNDLTILAYASFLTVNRKGVVHFHSSVIDLSLSDREFCRDHKNICTDQYGRYTPKFGNFSAFAKLQNQSKTLKKVISIGGAGSGAAFHYAIAHSSEFVRSAALIVRHYHLDGVDLDFEPESFTEKQSQAYAKLFAALRKTLGPDALITVAIAADQQIKRAAWKIIADNANDISVMCYDFHAPYHYPYYTGHNSNLYVDPNEPMLSGYYHISCNQAIKRLTFLGVPPRKIILGFPAYAIVYGEVPAKNHGLFQPFNPKKVPTEMPYFKVVNLLTAGFREYDTFYNHHLSAVWAYNPKTKQFLSYDNVALVREKLDYVNKNHLAGLMYWNINYEGAVKNQYSLLKAASR